MASYNRVILIGNVTRDIELRFTPSGLAVTEVGLAVNDRKKNASGEWVDDPNFFDITMFGRTAEIAGEYLSKGAPVFIEGRLKYDSWEKDGQKRSKVHVICDRMQLLSSRSDGGGSGSRQKQTASNTFEQNDQHVSEDSHSDSYQDENIPF